MGIACERGFVYTKPLLASFFLLSWRGFIFASGAESVPVPCRFGFMPPWALLCALWRLFCGGAYFVRARSRQAAAGALWLSEVEQPDSTGFNQARHCVLSWTASGFDTRTHGGSASDLEGNRRGCGYNNLAFCGGTYREVSQFFPAVSPGLCDFSKNPAPVREAVFVPPLPGLRGASQIGHPRGDGAGVRCARDTWARFAPASRQRIRPRIMREALGIVPEFFPVRVREVTRPVASSLMQEARRVGDPPRRARFLLRSGKFSRSREDTG